MKSITFISLISVLFIFSCAKNTKTEVSQEKKEAVIEEVNKRWEISGQGIEQKDAYKAFSVFSKDARYIREGHLYSHIDTAMNQYAEWFKNSPGPGSEVKCDPLYFDVINENTVVMTTIGSIESDPNQDPWIIGYTGVWIKEDGEWKLINFHTSWVNN